MLIAIDMPRGFNGYVKCDIFRKFFRLNSLSGSCIFGRGLIFENFC